MRIETGMLEVEFTDDATSLWRIGVRGGTRSISLRAPVVEIDGQAVTIKPSKLTRSSEAKRFSDGVVEHVVSGTCAEGLELKVILRIAEDSPVVRFCYVVSSSRPRRLTKSAGKDSLRYLSFSLQGFDRIKELRFSEFNELAHSYVLSEREIEARYFKNSMRVMGPMLVVEGDGQCALLAYEHGSQTPDAFLNFGLSPDRTVSLDAVKGNYLSGQKLDAANSYRTIWFQVAIIEGGEDDLARLYRDFVLRYQTRNKGSRRPDIFYNTWAYQERNKWRNRKKFLDSMHQDRIMAEIDVAHRMGVDVFVLDTGWYEKTGDWAVNRQRFPDGLKSVKAKLDGYGMRMGLWFDPTAAALTSAMYQNHVDCQRYHRGQTWMYQIWETEESTGMCLVSRYADAFANELIRLYHEVGVSYFKWDAIGQYFCDDHRHAHGGAEHENQERADSYAFQLLTFMNHVVDRLCAACPDAIVDFDVTEGGRTVGLGFLAAGKYFLVNNGPYFPNYDIPYDHENLWSNIFVHPGAARTWICRTPLTFDRWIPSVLFLTHYLPDDPAESQLVNIASLILGQNGIWGDLLAISDEGIERFGKLLGLYKQVKHAVTESSPVRNGAVGGSPEIHEKISAKTGQGAVVIFSSARAASTYVTAGRVNRRIWHTENVACEFDASGRAIITADMKQTGVAIIFFGVE